MSPYPIVRISYRNSKADSNYNLRLFLICEIVAKNAPCYAATDSHQLVRAKAKDAP